MPIKYHEKTIHYAVLFFSLIIIFMTKNLSMPNTGDFGRAMGWYMSKLPVNDLFLTYKIGDVSVHNFLNNFNYKSSYTILLYCYTFLLSGFTDTLDLGLLSAILKIIYIFSLFIFFSALMRPKYKKAHLQLLVFLIAIVPCISSSNLAFFSSFFQEQVVLVCLPILLFCLTTEQNKSFLLLVAMVTIVSCSKSQFFYLPLIIIFYYWIFNDGSLKKTLTMIAVFALACISIVKTDGTTELNKYHATYFGVYQLADVNGFDLPASIEKSCIGVDAWGNKFNIELGAEPTKIGMDCFNKLKDNVSFLDVAEFFIKRPLSIFSLPFDRGISTQLTEDYFHVYFSYPIIRNNTGILANLTQIKDELFKGNRLPVLFLSLFISILYRKRRHAGLFFVASSFAIAQFYISFFGEGYRDLAKHLFAMNFTFDLMVSAVTVLCVTNAINRVNAMIEGKVFMKNIPQLRK